MRALADSSRAGCRRRSARVATRAQGCQSTHDGSAASLDSLHNGQVRLAFQFVLFWTHAIKDSATLCPYALTIKCKLVPRQRKISQVQSCQVFCSSARRLLGRKPAVRALFCSLGNVPCSYLDGPPRRPGAWCPDATQADGCTCYGLLCTETVRSGTTAPILRWRLWRRACRDVHPMKLDMWPKRLTLLVATVRR